MQSKRVQEGRQSLHDTQDGEREDEPGRKHEDEEEGREDARVGSLGGEGALEGHVVQNLGELGVGERESPESEVRGRVGDATWKK